MPDYIDVTNQCTFDPPHSTQITSSGILNIVYNDSLSGKTYTAFQPYNVYPRSEFNSPYIFSNSVTNCADAFNGCTNFNSQVTLPVNARRCSNLFRNCVKFDQSVTIPPANTQDCNYMFYNCTNYNKYTYIPNSVIYCYRMFRSCTNFCSDVFIGTNVINYDGMFENCSSLNHRNFMISGNIRSAKNMFLGCSPSMNMIIRIPSKYPHNFTNMLSGRSSTASDHLEIYMNRLFFDGGVPTTDFMNGLMNMFGTDQPVTDFESSMETLPYWIRHNNYNIRILFNLG